MKSVLLALLTASLAWAAPPDLKLKAPDKPVAGGLVVVSADTTAKTVKWKVIGTAAVEDSGGRKVFFVASGKVQVLAVAVTETGDVSEFAEWSGDFTGGPDPAPGPDVDPTAVVVPADLSKAIKDAWAGETAADRADLAAAAATALDTAAAVAKLGIVKTAGDLEAAVRAVSVSVMGKGKLPLVNVAIGAYLSKTLPTDAAAVLTTADRAKAAAGYKAAAAAVRGLK